MLAVEEGATVTGLTADDGFSKAHNNGSDIVGDDLEDFGFDGDGEKEQNP